MCRVDRRVQAGACPQLAGTQLNFTNHLRSAFRSFAIWTRLALPSFVLPLSLCNMLCPARFSPNPVGARRLPLLCKTNANVSRLHHGSHHFHMHAPHKPCHPRQLSECGRMALHSSATTSNKSEEPSPLVKSIADAIAKEEIRLTGGEEMLLPIVFLKAEDAKSDQPILGDPFSQQLLDRCALDYSKTHFDRDYRYIKWVANRAKQFDIWCQV